jgi:hypothetical protein
MDAKQALSLFTTRKRRVAVSLSMALNRPSYIV